MKSGKKESPKIIFFYPPPLKYFSCLMLERLLGFFHPISLLRVQAPTGP